MVIFLEHKKFMEEVKRRAALRPELAFVEVDMGPNKPKVNLTLEEGRDLKQTVQAFAQLHGVQAKYLDTLEKALKGRIINPKPLLLILGVIIPSTGERAILAIPEGKDVNATVETGVFCAKHDNSKDVTATVWCQTLLERVDARLNTTFPRTILVSLTLDAPDGRKLQIIVRQGEQHDLRQFVSDFFEVYHMPTESVLTVANEIHKRLPNAEVQVPISLSAQRQVVARFSLNDNISQVVDGFINFYQLDESVKVAILKRARHGMAPGTFMV